VLGDEINLDLPLNSLPADEAQKLLMLIRDANFSEITENLKTPIKTDEFQYVITVQADKSTHTVHVTDSTMPLNLIPLVRELTFLKIYSTN
jgi:hypothetical protein